MGGTVAGRIPRPGKQQISAKAGRIAQIKDAITL
jgi:hypothetical protein